MECQRFLSWTYSHYARCVHFVSSRHWNDSNLCPRGICITFLRKALLRNQGRLFFNSHESSSFLHSEAGDFQDLGIQMPCFLQASGKAAFVALELSLFSWTGAWWPCHAAGQQQSTCDVWFTQVCYLSGIYIYTPIFSRCKNRSIIKHVAICFGSF